MVKEQQSISDLLRIRISDQLNKNFDYSLASNRKNDIGEFIEQNPKIKEKSIRTLYPVILKEVLQKKGIDFRSMGIKEKRPPKFYASDLDAKITPEPQAGSVEKKLPQAQAPPPAGSPQVRGEVPPISQFAENFTVEGVIASWNAVSLMLRLAYPDLELLTDEEKDALGKMWLPAFQRCLTEKWAIIGVPLIATTGILLPKVIKARKLKKEKESKEAALKKIKTN